MIEVYAGTTLLGYLTPRSVELSEDGGIKLSAMIGAPHSFTPPTGIGRASMGFGTKKAAATGIGQVKNQASFIGAPGGAALAEDCDPMTMSDDEEDEHEESPEAHCPMCYGEGVHMGGLGNLDHFRCRDCGAQFSQKREGGGFKPKVEAAEEVTTKPCPNCQSKDTGLVTTRGDQGYHHCKNCGKNFQAPMKEGEVTMDETSATPPAAMAEEQHAGPHDSFPITGAKSIKSAWDLAGHAADPSKVREHIKHDASKDGLTSALPKTARMAEEDTGYDTSVSCPNCNAKSRYKGEDFIGTGKGYRDNWECPNCKTAFSTARSHGQRAPQRTKKLSECPRCTHGQMQAAGRRAGNYGKGEDPKGVYNLASCNHCRYTLSEYVGPKNGMAQAQKPSTLASIPADQGFDMGEESAARCPSCGSKSLRNLIYPAKLDRVTGKPSGPDGRKMNRCLTCGALNEGHVDMGHGREVSGDADLAEGNPNAWPQPAASTSVATTADMAEGGKCENCGSQRLRNGYYDAGMATNKAKIVDHTGRVPYHKCLDCGAQGHGHVDTSKMQGEDAERESLVNQGGPWAHDKSVGYLRVGLTEPSWLLAEGSDAMPPRCNRCNQDMKKLYSIGSYTRYECPSCKGTDMVDESSRADDMTQEQPDKPVGEYDGDKPSGTLKGKYPVGV